MPSSDQTVSPRDLDKEPKFRAKITLLKNINFIDLALMDPELEPFQFENVKPSSGPRVCPIGLNQDSKKFTLLGLIFKTNSKLLSLRDQ